MSKIYNKKRALRINRKKKTKEKIRKLVQKYVLSSSAAEKSKIKEKILKIKPYVDFDKYIKNFRAK